MGRAVRKVYICTINNRKVADYVAGRRPLNYQQCLQEAQDKEVAFQMMDPNRKDRRHAINAIPTGCQYSSPSGGNPNGLCCSNCYATDHLWRDCTVMAQLREDDGTTRRMRTIPRGRHRDVVLQSSPLPIACWLSQVEAVAGTTEAVVEDRTTATAAEATATPSKKVQSMTSEDGVAGPEEERPTGNNPGRA